MRIAIDCRTILNPGYGEDAGVGHYTSAIVKAMLRLDRENEYVLFFGTRLGEPAIENLVGDHPKVKIRQYSFHDYRKALPAVHSHVLVAHAIAKEKPDLLFVPTHEVPMFYQGRTVIFVHDLAILRNPDWFVQVKAERSVSTGLLLPRGIKKADKILVPSQATKSDLSEFFPASQNKTVVVPHGVRRHEPEEHPLTDKMQQRFGIDNKYILSLCTLEPRKNVAGAIRAFAKLLDKHPEQAENLSFVIAGKKGWKYEQVFEELERVNRQWERPVVRYVGYVTSHEKWALLANAQAFVYPSYYEGFGLPVLEAMSVATPVITSRVSSLPEVGGDAVLYADPDQPGSIAHMIERLLDEPENKKIAESGLERSRQFSWTTSAEATLKELNQNNN